MEIHEARETDPVDVGAKFKILGDGPDIYRCTNIWIDEDGVVHLTLDTDANDRPQAKVPYDDLREKLLSGMAERVNSGHQAWRWRNNQ